MRKRNLFSKIVAGIGALAMVATMLPAMSLSAEAAGTITIVPVALTPDTAVVKPYPTNASMLKTPWAIPDEANWTWNTDSKGDVKFIIIPRDYYEFEGGEDDLRCTITPHSIDSGGATNPWNTNWNGADAQTVKQNKADESGRSFIVTIPAEAFQKNGTINVQPPQAKLLEVKITVNVGTGVQARQESYYPRESDTITSSRTWTVTYNPAILNYKGSAGMYRVSDADHAATEVSVYDDQHDTEAPTKYSSEIFVLASKGATTRDLEVNVGAGYNLDEANENQDLYKYHDLVDALDGTDAGYKAIITQSEGKSKPLVGWEDVMTAVDDLTSYIGVYSINDKKMTDTQNVNWLLDADEEPVAAKAMNAVADKIEFPKTISENIMFTINPEDIYRLYVWGPANNVDDAAGMAVAWTAAGAEAADRLGNPNNALATPSMRYQGYKHVVININTQGPQAAKIKIQNGNEETTDRSVASIYKFSYVIRDKDGHRFDHLNGDVRDYESLSAEPQEFPGNREGGAVTYNRRWFQGPVATTATANGEQYWMDYKEGDIFEFTVKVDPTYDPTNMKVIAIGNDDQTTAGGAGGSPVQVPYDEATGTYKFEIGPNSPYRIVVRDLVKRDTVKVINIPEDDAIFHGDHNENYTVLTNRFYEYVPFLGLTDGWNTPGAAGLSCNVANPRYQVFIAANEEDTGLIDLVAFARPGAVATGVDWIGHDFPKGIKQKARIRFNDEFVNQADDILNTRNEQFQHGSFDNDRTDDRYGKGADFKVLVNGTAVTVGDDDTFEFTPGEDTTIEVEGVVRKYYVFMPALNGFDLELDPAIEAQREEYVQERKYDREWNDADSSQAIMFRSAIAEGDSYKFKLNSDSNSAPVVKAGTTTLTPDAEGWYSFVVRNDTTLSVEGINVDGFSDVANRTGEEQEAIKWGRDLGIFTGYDDNSFRPGNSTTRAEFVKMLFELKKGTAGNASFTDTTGHWAAGQIGWATSQSIVNGYPDGSFKPNQAITRAEVAQVIWKLAGSQGTSFKANFPDVSQGMWYSPAVNWNFEKSIVKGYTNGNFGPNDPIERAHMALILYRSYGQF